eukprot:Polyplicarium_translucidae@DN749_c0_g1_i1.p7
MLTFELWDISTGTEPVLAAAIFSYVVGRVACDYSMATFVRDKSSAGHVLTHVVGHALQSSNVAFWYWGFEVDYMRKYATLGARVVDTGAFYALWDEHAAAPHAANDVVRFLEQGCGLVRPADPQVTATPRCEALQQT